VTQQFGQAEIMRDGAPVTLNVRTLPGFTLRKGDEVVITDANEDASVFTVVPFNLGG
jgi:hypothetical protein